MLPKDKRKFAFWGLAAIFALSLCVIGSMNENAEMFKGATTTKTCASIYYGNTKPSSAPSAEGNVDAFETVNLPTTTAASSGYVGKTGTSVGNGIKLGSSKQTGGITFTFASSVSIYDAYFYACAYSSSDTCTVTVTTGTDTTTDSVSVTNSSAPSICDPATAGDLSSYAATGHVAFDVTTATTTLTLSCTSGKPIYLLSSYLHPRE